MMKVQELIIELLNYNLEPRLMLLLTARVVAAVALGQT